MSITTGTPETRTEHSKPLGYLNEMLVMAIPLGLIALGIVTLGVEAISWAGAIVWGAVAATAMTMFVAMGRAMGMTDMNMLDLLGSMVAKPHTGGSKMMGFAMHLMNGAILAIAGVYTIALLGFEVTWVSAGIWALFVSVLAMLMITSVGVIHPKIRDHEREDPGPAGTHMGAMTPVGIIMAHAVYGVALGLLYNAWPLV